MAAVLAGTGVALTLVATVAPPVREASGAEVSPDALAAGETLYVANCRMCHGMKGTAGIPLAGNAKLGDASYLAKTIIEGPGYMTGFGEHLNDEQIAQIATFVRNSWGNDFGPVGPEDVAAMR